MASTAAATTMTQFAIQLAGVALTLIGLSVTTAKPVLDKLNNVHDQLIELKVTGRNTESSIAELRRRVDKLEDKQ
jgi:hypothetical protein